MLYTSDSFYNLQEPYRFLAVVGAIILIIALLFLNRFFENRKLQKKIMADIKEKKANNQNSCVIYRGKIY